MDITDYVFKTIPEATLRRWLNVKTEFGFVTLTLTNVGTNTPTLWISIPSQDSVYLKHFADGVTDLDEIKRRVVAFLPSLGIYNIQELVRVLKENAGLDVVVDKDTVAICKQYGNRKFVETGIQATLSNKLPRGPAFAEPIFAERELGAAINYPGIHRLYLYFKSKAPIRCWIRINSLENMYLTKMEYVYELAEDMFLTVTVDHARLVIPSEEAITLFSRVKEIK